MLIHKWEIVGIKRKRKHVNVSKEIQYPQVEDCWNPFFYEDKKSQ